MSMQADRTPHLEYATPARLRRQSWLGPTLLWWLLLLFWIIAGLFVVPKCEAVFKDFKLELPLATRLIPRLIPRVPEGAEARRSSAGLILLVLGILCLAMSAIWLVVALYMPVLSLMGAISDT